MCGIAGALTANFSSDAEATINAIVKSQHNRGPDCHAVESIRGQNSAVVLGHNRLSIIDLSNKANQPMWDSLGRYCISYNGEIYNYLELRQELITLGYEFSTSSDTEVILNSYKAWGVEAVNRFNGPFAFALFDRAAEQLWLVRDRFGVKPLYYFIQNNSLFFASTSKVLATEFSLMPNLDYLAKGLRYLVYEDESDLTPYLGLKVVPAAYYLGVNFKNNKLNQCLVKYYDLQTNVFTLREELAQKTLPQLVAMLAQKLDSAISLRLRADVAIGISLSGGLDSSTVAALATEQNDNLIGFTFGHADVSTSEGPLVEKLAKLKQLKVNYIWPSASEMVQALPDVLKAQDAPFAGLSIVAQYLVYQKVKSMGIKVLLGGQGGDEGFMGYRKFQFFWLRYLLRQKKYAQSLLFLLQLLPLLGSELNRFKLYWQQRHRYIKSKELSSVLVLPEISNCNLNGEVSQKPWQRQLQDVTQFSLPTLLRYEDRNSMANSVESRLPFLDYQLLEFGLALPEAIKLNRGYGKWPVREIMCGKLPEEIRAARYKRGFDVPFADLIAAGLGQTLREQLHKNYFKTNNFLLNNISVSKDFSDNSLLAHPTRLQEAITLMWLGECNI